MSSSRCAVATMSSTSRANSAGVIVPRTRSRRAEKTAWMGSVESDIGDASCFEPQLCGAGLSASSTFPFFTLRAAAASPVDAPRIPPGFGVPDLDADVGPVVRSEDVAHALARGKLNARTKAPGRRWRASAPETFAVGRRQEAGLSWLGVLPCKPKRHGAAGVRGPTARARALTSRARSAV